MMIKLYDRRGKGSILEREVHCPRPRSGSVDCNVTFGITSQEKSEKMKNSYRFS